MSGAIAGVRGKWDNLPLREILTKSNEWIDLDPNQIYRQVTVRMWGQGVVQRNEVSGAEIAAKRMLTVHPKQFIVSRIDARHGATGLIPEELDGAIVTNDFPVFTPDSSKISPRFLSWMSKTHDFIELCKAASEGTTNRVRLKEEKFLAMEIALPPLDEQQRIVGQIEELVAKVEEARGLRSQATQQLKAFVSSVHLHLSESRIVKLGDILELDEKAEAVQLGRQYLQVGVKGFGGGLFAKEAVEASQTTYKAFNRLYEGAIVLSQVKGWEGAIAGCPASLAGRYVSPEYRTFRCIEGQGLPGYISALVITPWFWNQLKSLTRGLGDRRERTRPEQFLQMEVPMPTVNLQRKALESFGKLGDLERLHAQTAAELDALFSSILDKAFKGEL